MKKLVLHKKSNISAYTTHSYWGLLQRTVVVDLLRCPSCLRFLLRSQKRVEDLVESLTSHYSLAGFMLTFNSPCSVLSSFSPDKFKTIHELPELEQEHLIHSLAQNDSMEYSRKALYICTCKRRQ